MLNAKYFRENEAAIRKSLETRKSDYRFDDLLAFESEVRKINGQLQELKTKRNKGTIQVSESKKAGKPTDENLMSELAEYKKGIETLEATLPEVEGKLNSLMWNAPNILHESVPYGKDDTENVELRTWGTRKITKIPGHEEVLSKLGLIDLEQAAKVAGARFFYLKGDLALLEQALIHFAIEELVGKGYTLIAPPLMLKKEYYKGVTALGDFEEALYRAADPKESSEKSDLEHIDEELYMISTSEHPIAAMHAGQVFAAKDLPKRYIGFSPCFRREAGAHGKDSKGIFRVHQFYKIEQFIYSKPEDSWPLHEELIQNAESLFQKLNIPYHVVNICTGDIGTVAAKKYDIEAWMPAQQKYREVVSGSNCTDWQSLRLDIKYDDKGERKHVHTLNCTAIATNRTMVAIVENYVNDDGTITVPDALVQYMGKDRITAAKQG
ncbi:Serine--tRNA ligase [uncultured archaeon]|nr:Serine--tRNA ligase [uncultured archaeon]